MKYLVISCSLSAESKSRVVAKEIQKRLGRGADFIDLRDCPLPFCDGGAAFAHKNVAKVTKAIASADAIVVAVPIYNFNVNGAAKNLIELTGDAWTGKTVGFASASGGQRSYMAVMGIANSLMLDFRCVIVPRFVNASRGSVAGGKIVDEDLVKRLDEFVTDFSSLAGRLTTSRAR